MSKVLCRQYNLEHGNEHLTAWLDAIDLRVGTKVTLRDSENPTIFWKVVGIGDTVLPKDEIKGAHDSKKWHGNDMPRGRIKGLKITN